MSKQKSNYFFLWLGFFILPVLPFVYAIQNFRIKKFHIFILLYAMFAGYSFLPIAGSDGESYQTLFKQYSSITFDGYWQTVSSLYSVKSQITDIYSVTMLFFISRFSSNPAVFTMVIALVYYFFFIKLFDLIINLHPSKNINNGRYFLLGCIFIITFMLGINSVRWALAFVVFSYGALKFIKTNKLSSLLIAASSVLIHFSLLYSTLFLLIFLITQRIQNTPLLYTILLVSVVFTGVFSSIISSNIGLGGDAIGGRYAGYTNEGYIQSRTESLFALNWYAIFDRFATFYFAVAALVASRLPIFNFRLDTIARKLFGFAIIMLIHSIFSGVLVDPFSNRYYILSNFFILVYLFYLCRINPNSHSMKRLQFIYLPILILHIIWNLRVDIDCISPLMLIGNPILLLITNIDKSLWYYINGIL
jgi:hypothetical protein